MSLGITRYALLLLIDLSKHALDAKVSALPESERKKQHELNRHKLPEVLKSGASSQAQVRAINAATLKNIFRGEDPPPSLFVSQSILDSLSARLAESDAPLSRHVIEAAVDFEQLQFRSRSLAGSPKEAESQLIELTMRRSMFASLASLTRDDLRRNPDDGRELPQGLRSAGSLVLFDMLNVIACYAIANVLGIDDDDPMIQPTAGQRTAINRETEESLQCLESDLTLLANALGGYEGDLPSKTFPCLRLFVFLNRGHVQIHKYPNPSRRIAAGPIQSAWSEQIHGWLAVVPDAVLTTRVLRHLLEFAQYAQQWDAVISIWEEMKARDDGFRPPVQEGKKKRVEGDRRYGIMHWPATWRGQSRRGIKPICCDDHLCSAATLIQRYEVALDQLSHTGQARRKARNGFDPSECLLATREEEGGKPNAGPCALHPSADRP